LYLFFKPYRLWRLPSYQAPLAVICEKHLLSNGDFLTLGENIGKGKLKANNHLHHFEFSALA